MTIIAFWLFETLVEERSNLHFAARRMPSLDEFHLRISRSVLPMHWRDAVALPNIRQYLPIPRPLVLLPLSPDSYILLYAEGDRLSTKVFRISRIRKTHRPACGPKQE
jgi:hypothetical protein